MPSMSRRRALACLAGISGSGWFHGMRRAMAAPRIPGRRRSCIVLWMAGGPTQTDTFDMKPHHTNGGEFRETATNVPGVRFSEHLPLLAAQADKLAIVRSLSSPEGDHARGTYFVRTGFRPGSNVQYPALGSSLAKELGTAAGQIPDYISINPFVGINPEAFGSGFLGPQYAPAAVSASSDSERTTDAYAELNIANLSPPPQVTTDRLERRLELWQEFEAAFARVHPDEAATQHRVAYERAFRAMDSDADQLFDLSDEPAVLREAYGRGVFGQSCLVARRLVEAGVPLVEVSLGVGPDNPLGWDTHADNFAAVKRLSAELDAGWGTLMTDLEQRGLLDETTLLWIGEFGRTPRINGNGGRDHFPAAWSCVLAGGGIAGGQTFGRTSADGMEVVEDKVSVQDVLSTLCHAVGVDPGRENLAAGGRPIKIAEGTPIRSLLT